MVAWKNIVDQLFHLIRHANEFSRQPVDLLALLDNNTVHLVDRMICVSQVDFKLLDPALKLFAHFGPQSSFGGWDTVSPLTRLMPENRIGAQFVVPIRLS